MNKHIKICCLSGHLPFWGPAARFVTESFASDVLAAEMDLPSMTPHSDP